MRRAFSGSGESTVTPQHGVSSPAKTRQLSVVPASNGEKAALTRGQVAARLNISVSTVRRYEGERLHPTVDEQDVRWFDEREVAALAAELINSNSKRVRPPETSRTADARSPGELAALVFERLEQRQSLAEIVIGLRIAPEVARSLFDQWSLGFTEGQLRLQREPNVPRVGEVPRANSEKFVALLAALPEGELTRISVARLRTPFMNGDHEYVSVIELGGFHVSGPCDKIEIVGRYGNGAYRVSAFGFNPAGIRWEVLVEGLRDG